MLYDLHVHTDMSDGFIDAAAYAALAREKYSGLGIADHISPYHKIRDEKSFDRYLRELDRHDVLKGGEICLGADLAISEKSLEKLDYIIGSMHALRFEKNLSLFFFNSALRFPDVPHFIGLYTERLVDFLNNVKMDILGHPTLLPLFLQKKEAGELFSADQISSIVRAGVKNNVAFEISSRWMVPSEAFLAECRRQDTQVALGSDAHSDDLAFNFDYALQMMERTGLDRDSLYVPLKKG
jgi:histidinol phosphatase-like PHP family hydrolase